MRGYAAIALVQPKCGQNVGGAMRAAGVYGAALIVLGGKRANVLTKHPTDTMKAWKHVPTVCVDNVLDYIPNDCVPVAVELTDDAQSLVRFRHPERAYYIFGPEDGDVPSQIISKCAHVVKIPTERCMNLAATVNVVLYDRLAKELLTQAEGWR